MDGKRGYGCAVGFRSCYFNGYAHYLRNQGRPDNKNDKLIFCRTRGTEYLVLLVLQKLTECFYYQVVLYFLGNGHSH